MSGARSSDTVALSAELNGDLPPTVERLYAAISDELFLPSTTGLELNPYKGGGLFALSLNDGKQVWYAPAGKMRVPATTAVLRSREP